MPRKQQPRWRHRFNYGRFLTLPEPIFPLPASRPAFIRPGATRLGFIFLVMSCVGGCGAPTGTPTVSDSTIVLVLADLHVVDVQQYMDARDSNWSSTRNGAPLFETGAARDSVFEAHGITPEQYDAKVEELVEDPDRFLAIYEEVLSRLSVQASQ